MKAVEPIESITINGLEVPASSVEINKNSERNYRPFGVEPDKVLKEEVEITEFTAIVTEDPEIPAVIDWDVTVEVKDREFEFPGMVKAEKVTHFSPEEEIVTRVELSARKEEVSTEQVPKKEAYPFL